MCAAAANQRSISGEGARPTCNRAAEYRSNANCAAARSPCSRCARIRACHAGSCMRSIVSNRSAATIRGSVSLRGSEHRLRHRQAPVASLADAVPRASCRMRDQAHQGHRAGWAETPAGRADRSASLLPPHAHRPTGHSRTMIRWLRSACSKVPAPGPSARCNSWTDCRSDPLACSLARWLQSSPVSLAAQHRPWRCQCEHSQHRPWSCAIVAERCGPMRPPPASGRTASAATAGRQEPQAGRRSTRSACRIAILTPLRFGRILSATTTVGRIGCQEMLARAAFLCKDPKPDWRVRQIGQLRLGSARGGSSGRSSTMAIQQDLAVSSAPRIAIAPWVRLAAGLLLCVAIAATAVAAADYRADRWCAGDRDCHRRRDHQYAARAASHRHSARR